jgi:hypothetical protein
MVAGDVTVQEVFEAIAEHAMLVDGVNFATANPQQLLKQLPAVVVDWFPEEDTNIIHSSTQLWTIAARATLYAGAIVGNNPQPDLALSNNLTMGLVDKISEHPDLYPYPSLMSNLHGVHHIKVTRVRPAKFGLEYAGHKYFGAELFIEIKLHRRVAR